MNKQTVRGLGADSRITGWVIAVLFVLALVWLMREPLFQGLSLQGPDFPRHAPAVEKAGLPGSFLGSWATTRFGMSVPPSNPLPRRLALFVMEPAAYHHWSYMLDVALLFASTAFLLLGMGVRLSFAWVGAAAMGLSAHSFTLIAAGHLGKFGMLPYAVAMFAFLVRALRTRLWRHFAMTGLCAGVGMSEHQDIMLMFGLVAVAYVVLALAIGARDRRAVEWARHGGGLVLAGSIFLAYALPTILGALLITIPGREGVVDAEVPARKYEFATNWSLPPEELVEFVAPCVFGVETADANVPYWGRLGRTVGWEQSRQGLMNLRQHTVYFGTLQLVLAALAFAWALGGGAPVWETGVARDTRTLSLRTHALFWGAVWTVAVLLALGRYTPFYRLFYAFPYADNIRAPVKFLHLAELATAVLLAIGLDRLFAEPLQTRGRRVLVAVCAAAGGLGVLVLAVGVHAATRPAYLVSTWSLLGMDALADHLAANMTGALLRAAFGLVAAAVAVAAIAFSHRARSAPGWIACGLAVWLLVDVARVNDRYVKTKDARGVYASDVVTVEVQARARETRVACAAYDGVGQIWMQYRFPQAGVGTLDFTGMSGMPPMEQAFLDGIGKNMLRLWQLAAVGYVVGPRGTQFVEALLAHPAFEAVRGVRAMARLGGGVNLVETPLDGASHVLIRNRSALPRFLLFHDWETVDETTVGARLGAPDWDPTKRLLVDWVGQPPSVAPGGPARPVRIETYERKRIRVEVEGDRDGVLYIADQYDGGWVARVGGAPAPVLRCNGLLRGVPVPPGRHVVELHFRSPFAPSAWLRIGTLCATLAGVAMAAIHGSHGRVLRLLNRSARIGKSS